MAHKLGLENICTLSEQKGLLKKLVVFVPEKAVETLRKALFDAGAGEIGNYSSCSFNTQGQGSFKAGNNTNPYVGKPGELHFENEVRIETIFPAYLQYAVVSAMLKVHPYEEPAYDIYSLENTHHKTGLGVIGNLPRAVDSKLFLQKVKKAFACKVIRHTAIHKPKIEKVALLGGSGSSYLHEAIAAGADIFITADVKYHEFFEAGNKIIFADIGHFESEQFTKELFYEIVTNKFSKFAVRLSEVTTNPMNYLI
jgi:hypothetical protein